MLKATELSFHGATLTVFRDREDIRVDLRSICNALAIDWQAQHRRLMRDDDLARALVLTPYSWKGRQQVAATLNVDFLNAWLFGIRAGRLPASTRKALSIYKRECGKAIRAYGRADHIPAAAQTDARVIAELLHQFQSVETDAARQLIHQLIARETARLGLDCPSFNDLAPNYAAEIQARPFWEALIRLEEQGVRFNHARLPMALAIRRNELSQLFEAAGTPLPLDSALMNALRLGRFPIFSGLRAVNSRLAGRAVHCWTFKHAGDWVREYHAFHMQNHRAYAAFETRQSIRPPPPSS